jgi:hypothetical protein
VRKFVPDSELKGMLTQRCNPVYKYTIDENIHATNLPNQTFLFESSGIFTILYDTSIYEFVDGDVKVTPSGLLGSQPIYRTRPIKRIQEPIVYFENVQKSLRSLHESDNNIQNLDPTGNSVGLNLEKAGRY